MIHTRNFCKLYYSEESIHVTFQLISGRNSWLHRRRTHSTSARRQWTWIKIYFWLSRTISLEQFGYSSTNSRRLLMFLRAWPSIHSSKIVESFYQLFLEEYFMPDCVQSKIDLSLARVDSAWGCVCVVLFQSYNLHGDFFSSNLVLCNEHCSSLSTVHCRSLSTVSHCHSTWNKKFAIKLCNAGSVWKKGKPFALHVKSEYLVSLGRKKQNKKTRFSKISIHEDFGICLILKKSQK